MQACKQIFARGLEPNVFFFVLKMLQLDDVYTAVFQRGQQRTRMKFSQPQNISPSPKTDLEPKSGMKKPETNEVRSTNVRLLLQIKFFIADKLWRDSNNCVIIIALILAQSRHLM